ncbi:MAG TPA: hypothetical protein GX010_00755 [Erysipelotrichaceae bacterium]|nr:hypothetical protein [Erysipelotrichaceae bacterium]
MKKNKQPLKNLTPISKTKYPIILVHGIAIKDFGLFKSFGKIDRYLIKEGFKVYKSKADGFGTIENNALFLKKEILKILEENNVEKINIIAHSKGGLDAKYMIEYLDMSKNVASLTTLCTPHKGSPIATHILNKPRWLLKFLAFWINLWYRILGDKKPDAYRVCKQLATIDSVEDETMKITSEIYCQSYSTTLKRSRDDFIMGIPLKFYHRYEKGTASDGLVGRESTQFGEYKGEAFEESMSHSEIIDFMASKKKKEKIYAFYTMICEDLKERGF